MKKIIALLAVFTLNSSFAIALLESNTLTPACRGYKLQMKQNHQSIDNAYLRSDACTMGKLMMQNRQIYESHPECFPRPAAKKTLLVTPQG